MSSYLVLFCQSTAGHGYKTPHCGTEKNSYSFLLESKKDFAVVRHVRDLLTATDVAEEP